MADRGANQNSHLRKLLVRMHYSLTHVQTAPELRMVGFFSFTTVQKRCAFSRNLTLIFELCPFPRLVMCAKILSREAGQQTAAPSQI